MDLNALAQIGRTLVGYGPGSHMYTYTVCSALICPADQLHDISGSGPGDGAARFPVRPTAYQQL